MPIVAFPGLAPAVPEVVLVCAAMALLIIGVLRGEGSSRLVSWLSVAVLIATLVVAGLLGGERQVGFYGMFVSDAFAVFMKALVLLGSAVTIIMGLRYNEEHGIARFEFPVLVLLATTGMMVMISANDLITLYVGLELQNLALYVVASFNRDSVRSSEAGLKYFVLGALSSGMLLYGASLIYGFTGSTSFTAIATAAKASGAAQDIGLIVGLVFLLVGIAFKISAVPFHMWTPDIYEGAPTPVTTFFAAAPKAAAIALLMRVTLSAFAGVGPQWQQVVAALAIASMGLGAFAAIGQTNIKRLLAYSAIGNIGYALIGLACASPEGARGVIIYMVIYVAMTLGAFACVLAMRRPQGMVEDIDELAGLAQTNLAMATVLALLLFSLAGIPPLAGFFAKFYVFVAAIKAGLFTLAVIGVLASVVGAFYYLTIIKVMYFDEPLEKLDPISLEFGTVVAVAGIFNIFFF